LEVISATSIDNIHVGFTRLFVPQMFYWDCHHYTTFQLCTPKEPTIRAQKTAAISC